jgi:Domain of unknown function (DUF4207)
LRREQKENEEREKQAKMEKCKAAVEKWMADAKKKPRTVPSSYGYCSGKLTGLSTVDSRCGAG